MIFKAQIQGQRWERWGDDSRWGMSINNWKIQINNKQLERWFSTKQSSGMLKCRHLQRDCSCERRQFSLRELRKLQDLMVKVPQKLGSTIRPKTREVIVLLFSSQSKGLASSSKAARQRIIECFTVKLSSSREKSLSIFYMRRAPCCLIILQWILPVKLHSAIPFASRGLLLTVSGESSIARCLRKVSNVKNRPKIIENQAQKKRE